MISQSILELRVDLLEPLRFKIGIIISICKPLLLLYAQVVVLVFRFGP